MPAVLDTATVVSMSALLASDQKQMCELKLRHAVAAQVAASGRAGAAEAEVAAYRSTPGDAAISAVATETAGAGPAATTGTGVDVVVVGGGESPLGVVDVRLEVTPPVSSDLRPIEKWIASIAFYAAVCHRRLVANPASPGASSASSGSGGCGVAVSSRHDGAQRGSPRGRAVARVSGDHASQRYSVSVEHEGRVSSIQLESADGFFYYPHHDDSNGKYQVCAALLSQ